MLYNNPEASGRRHARGRDRRDRGEVDGLVAVKECSGDARRIPALIAAAPQLEILVGGDDWALEGFAAGATGWVTGVADIAPRECVALYEHVAAGELEAARDIYERLLPLARFDMTPKLVQYFKAAQDAAGLHGGPCREPRLPLDGRRPRGARAALAALREARPRVRAARYFAAVDSHTEGMPTRVITGGVGADPGRHDARAQAALRGRISTTCGCC